MCNHLSGGWPVGSAAPASPAPHGSTVNFPPPGRFIKAQRGPVFLRLRLWTTSFALFYVSILCIGAGIAIDTLSGQARPDTRITETGVGRLGTPSRTGSSAALSIGTQGCSGILGPREVTRCRHVFNDARFHLHLGVWWRFTQSTGTRFLLHWETDGGREATQGILFIIPSSPTL
ncbi:hypothetical protein N657DRAFT_434124 [Parathielavia appendiculata]|uniref:Uncharacterized protein n=1 Tax=Parathielavia appendiculata TaxID=2587402 RepID=A0AAN6U023_9PEZI|nr:hypothetical protein N657DRAFT_434124 [Parathielavia appendiculata]